MQHSTRKNKIIVSIFKIAIASGLLFYLQRDNKLNFKEVSFFFNDYILVFLLWIGAVFYSLLGGIRVYLLTNGFNIRTNFFECIKLALVGNFFNYISPGTLGGDIVRGYYLSKLSQKAKSQLYTLVVLDRVIGLASMLLSGWLWFFILPGHEKNSTILSGLGLFLNAYVLVFIATLLIFQNKKINFHIHSFFHSKLSTERRISRYTLTVIDTFLEFISQFRLVVKMFTITLLTNLTVCLLAFFISINLNSPKSLEVIHIFSGTILGFVTTIIPVAPAGVGVGHLGFSYIFDELSGVNSSFGADLFTILIIIIFMASWVGGIIYLVSPPTQKNKRN